jgi:outer membrane protein TolC
MMAVLALLLAESVDLSSVSQLADTRSPRVLAARARADGNTATVALEQPSPFPSLRAGTRIWPAGSDSFPANPDETRYRIYAQLRLPLLVAAAAWKSREVESAMVHRGEWETRLARGLLWRDLATSYAVARTAAEAAPVYGQLLDVQKRQLEVLKSRTQEGAATAAELKSAEEAVAQTLAAQDEMRHTGATALGRLQALTGRDFSYAHLEPVPQSDVADADDAARRARAGRAEVHIRLAEAKRWQSEADVAWRKTIDVDLGVGYSRGTTGTLDELNGISMLIELSGPIDQPWRAARDKERGRALAHAAELDAADAAEQVAAEARGAFDAWRRAHGLVAVAQARLDAARAEHARLLGRRGVALPQATTMPQVVAAEAAEKSAEVQMIEALGQTEVTYVALAAAMGADPAAPPRDEPPRHAPLPAVQPRTVPLAGPVVEPERPIAHGLWVWKTAELLRDPTAATTLRAFCAATGVTEIYLSVPKAVLADSRLPMLVATLRRGGLRVEALMGEPGWYRAQARDALGERIAAIGRFDSAHPEARFAAVHLDIEPHQLRENKGAANLAYLPELTETLGFARGAASRAGMDLAADLPRKLLHASLADGQALARACPRLVFMLYELPPGVDPAELIKPALAWHADVVIGIRHADHGDGTRAAGERIETALTRTPGFAGWAVHDYASWRGLSRHGRRGR